jgi:hypothetical protein
MLEARDMALDDRLGGLLLCKCFELLWSLLVPYRLSLCVLRRIYRPDYEKLFQLS